MVHLVCGSESSEAQRQFSEATDPAELLKASTFPEPTLKRFLIFMFPVFSHIV